MDSIVAAWSPRVLSILRIVAGISFLEHATARFFKFPHVAMFDQFQVFSLSGAAGIIELIGSILVILGLFTRISAFILSGEMAVAYFMVHAPISFFPIINHGESALLFCFIFFYLAFAGGGEWSVDKARGAP